MLMRKFTIRNAFMALVFLSLFCVNANCGNVPDGQFITIQANGVSNTFSLGSFQKAVIEDATATNPTLKVDLSDGKSYLKGVRTISFTLDESAGDDNVKVVATNNTAEIFWPAVDGAQSYIMTICKDLECNDVLCTLKFNSSGQLVEISFGGTDEGHGKSTRPMSFNVTGLEPGTVYKYSIKALGSAGQVIDEQTGQFTTLLTSAYENTEDNIQVYSNGSRIVVDAPMEHNISFYDVMGRQLGECVRTNHCECVISLVGVYIVKVDDKQYKIRTN